MFTFRQVIYTLYLRYVEIGDMEAAAMTVDDIAKHICSIGDKKDMQKTRNQVLVNLNRIKRKWGKVKRTNPEAGNVASYWCLTNDGLQYCASYLELYYDYTTDTMIKLKPSPDTTTVVQVIQQPETPLQTMLKQQHHK